MFKKSWLRFLVDKKTLKIPTRQKNVSKNY